MKKRKRRFVVRAKFAVGEIVYQHGTVTPLKVTNVLMARPGYETNDGRFFAEDEIDRTLNHFQPRKKKAG